MLEREMKLMVDEAFEMPALDGTVPRADIGPVEERPIHDVYHDTADYRLARWGCTLRFRDGDGWTAKIPAPGTGRVLSRHEITFGGTPERPPPRVLALVRSLTRGEPVVEVARFTTRRSARTWRTADGVELVELVDDRVEVERPDGGCARWRELELELASGADEPVLADIVARLESAGARSGETRPKLVHAVGDPALAPPDVVEPVLPEKPTARDVIRAAIARSVTHLLLHLPAARLSEDPEGVHQARVATRRLRSDLRTFRSLLDPEWARELEQELCWLADDLGRVRDADVLLDRLQVAVDEHPQVDRAGAVGLLRALEQQRRRDRRTLVDHLNRRRADQLLDRLVAATANPETTRRADGPAAARLTRLVRRRWRRLERAVEGLDAEPPVDELHRVRILAKRTRYAAEAVTPACGREAKRFAKAIAGIQDVLGELNDAAVAEQRLAELAETASGPAAFAAGRLAEILTSEGRRFRHGWEEHYRRARASKRSSWLGSG